MSDTNKFSTRFSVEVVRSGQPRPYADTFREYKVYCERFQAWGKPEEQGWKPGIPGVIFGQAECDSNGVPTNEYMRKRIDAIVLGTCQNFYRSETEPGACWASPILKSLKVDATTGIIHVLIIEAYTD